MDRKVFLAIFCVALITLTGFLVFGNAASGGPKVIDCRKLTFYDEMDARLEAYNESHDWTLKVHPSDLEYLGNVTGETLVYIETYVSNPKEAVEYDIDCSTNETVAIYLVYQATDEQVEEFLKIPHDRFYKSKFQPCICMEVTAKDLETIAQLPFVYCIRVGPREISIEALDDPIVTSSISIEDARTYDKIKYVLQNKDSDVDQMQIAVIDTGYDAAESPLNHVASDNIRYAWDFYDGDASVNDGINWHGTTCLDLMATAFGDSGDGDSMYDDPSIYCVLKIGEGDDYNLDAARSAIEWCLNNDPEVVSMSWGGWSGYKDKTICQSWWCDLFKTGAENGITWVAASGKVGYTTIVPYPSQCYWVIGVGSYSYISGGNAYRSSFSDYGTVIYAVWKPQGPYVYCGPCYLGGGMNEFKPSIYDAGEITGVGEGTSFATPLAAACIAMGVYSSGADPGRGQNWIPGYSNVLSAIYSCHTYPVKPDASSLNGDVMDCSILWDAFD